ncbi:hypothetical protein [Halomontanus rarus]
MCVCEQIIERHNGDIWTNSKPGRGTTVLLNLAVG